MADYYTKPEADGRFSQLDHTHNLEDLGGTGISASLVIVSEEVAPSFGDAFTVDEALASAATQLADKANAGHTHTGYAAASHTHAEFAASGHTHTPASIGAAPASHTHDYAAGDHSHTPASIGAAPASHTHDYAAPNHTHTPAALGAAAASHTHTPEAVGAAPATHSHNYAAPTHSHAQTDITGLEAALTAKAPNSALAAKADLVNGKVPASQLPSYMSDVIDGTLVNSTTFQNGNGVTVTPEADKLYNDTTENKSYRWSGTAYVAMNEGVALGETAETAYRGDRGKTAYDHSQNGNVHVTTAEKTAWNGKAAGNHTHTPADIGAAAASHGHSYNDLSDKPTIPAAYSHPASHPASMISGLATVATTGKYSDLSDKPAIPTSLPANGGNADTVDGKHADDFAVADHTHNYAAPGHNHNSAYIDKILQMTADTGDVKHSWYGKDVVAEITALPTGMHTAYAPSGATNAPKAGGGTWRFLVHKAGVNFGWVQAFCLDGSFYVGVLSAGAWKGWRCIFDASPAPLWTGAYYMIESHTVTPTKKLSECAHGWVLLWSDYDPGDGAKNYDFVTTMVPKRAYTGQAWAGGQFICDIPRHFPPDPANEGRICKFIQIYDDKIVGHSDNSVAPRNDVVLRAVYEF